MIATHDDVTASRHCGNQESAEAHRLSQDKARTYRQRILQLASRPEGITCREFAASLGLGLNCVSGRFTELKHSELIRKVGVRERSGVYVLNLPTAALS